MEKLPEEFANAFSIVKPHRFAIEPTDDGANLYFGLLGADGESRYFRIHSNDVAYFGIEMRELSRATKYMALQKSEPLPPVSHLPFKLPLSEDGSIAPFVGPELKFHHAKVHFGDLEDLISQYSRRVKVGAKEIEQKDGIATWEVVFSEAPPASIPLILGDALHNLRSSLDHLICDLARQRGKRADLLKFPFAVDEAALKNIMKKDNHESILGTDVVEAIVALRPYKTNGSKLLRALHDLDIADKHQLILPTYSAVWHRYDFSEVVADLIVKNNPLMKRPKIAFVSDGMEHTFFREGDRIQLPVGEAPLKHYKAIDQPMQVRFALGATALSGAPVLDAVDEILNLVQEILLDFKTKFFQF